MARNLKLKDVPLSGLLTMQQVTEFGSAEISDLYFKALDSFQKKLVSRSYIDKLENDLEKRLETNNAIVNELGIEITRRIKTIFPDVNLSSNIARYKLAYAKELEDYKKLYSTEEIKPEEKPVITPTFKASREKKHDNK